ncbi:MAG TPA: PEGA domain-containing protein, partial [Phycisphaerae bacterium]|nr:PEGA domain-containing protein [Phycisphaerae bacterium]
MSAIDPLACERCGRRLESDDAISVIEGVCGVCRNTAQSLVQPRRADELLMTRRISDEADDFLADLPKIEPWSPSPIPSEPWLVDEASARRERVSASVASFLGDDTDDDIEDATTDEAPAEAECESLEFDDEEASDVAPMIPPGPFAAVRRRGPAIKNPVETVSEIFDDGIPPSEPFVADADEDASDASDRVDIHRFTPPPMDFPRAGAPKRRRRKRAVTIGVCFGVLLTAAAGWLASDKAMRQRVMAWVNEIRQIEPDVVTDEPIQLSFLIDPPNAEVRLDGVRLEPSETSGRVELSVTVNTMDDRRLEVSAPGYHTKSQTLRDFRGIDEIVMQLTHLPFEAEIATDPPGAEIFLEGQLVGVSPVQVTIDPEVGAEVVARMSGYKPVSRTLRAPEEGESLQMRVPLEPAGVRLAIDTAPVPAQIWVNDRLFGMAPMDVDLDYHFLGQDVEIVARAEGFDDARMTIPMPSVGGDEMDASI